MKAYLLGTNSFIKRESIEDIRKAIGNNFNHYESIAECSVKCVYENTFRGMITISIIMQDDSVFTYKIVE